jgi:hypothetical protein
MSNPDGYWQRDPVSVLFDTGARALLARAYANRGQWQATRLANPTIPLAGRLARTYGIRWDGPDNARTASGKKLNARTRWGRGFVRSVYYVNKAEHGGRGGAIEIEIGRALPRLGVLPPGRAVRVRTRVGGRTALRSVQAKSDVDRIYDSEGGPAGRFAGGELAALRDW